MNKLLSPVGGCFVLHCNFDTSKLKTQLPAYYKECLDAWSDLNGKNPSSPQEVLNEIIRNNKFICVDKRSTYRKDFIYLGFLTIGDLISVNSSCSLALLTPSTSPEQRFFLMSIVNSIPSEWRSLAKAPTIISLRGERNGQLNFFSPYFFPYFSPSSLIFSTVSPSSLIFHLSP